MRKVMGLVLVAALVIWGTLSAPVMAGADAGVLLAQAGNEGLGSDKAGDPEKGSGSGNEGTSDKVAPSEPGIGSEKGSGLENGSGSGKSADAGSGPEKIIFEKVGKMGPVEFPHKLHGEKNACKDCHEAEKPLFEQKISNTGFKMTDMYAGKSCGACHDGKDKHPFEAKKACAKCHKKK